MTGQTGGKCCNNKRKNGNRKKVHSIKTLQNKIKKINFMTKKIYFFNMIAINLFCVLGLLKKILKILETKKSVSFQLILL